MVRGEPEKRKIRGRSDAVSSSSRDIDVPVWVVLIGLGMAALALRQLAGSFALILGGRDIVGVSLGLIAVGQLIVGFGLVAFRSWAFWWAAGFLLIGGLANGLLALFTGDGAVWVIGSGCALFFLFRSKSHFS